MSNKKRKQHRNPFKAKEYSPNAKLLKGDNQRPIMDAAVTEHVVGQRVTGIRFDRTLDEEESARLGAPMDVVDLVVYLENNVAYVARLSLSSFAIINRADALQHLQPDDEFYVEPSKGE